MERITLIPNTLHYHTCSPLTARGLIQVIVLQALPLHVCKNIRGLREGFCDAILVVEGDRAVGAESCNLQSHDHAEVMMGGVAAASELGSS